MNVTEFEQLIITELKKVVEKIINDNPKPNISAKSRAGAEISELLEREFVNHTVDHVFFKDSKASPKGKTKNPWDAKTYFTYKEHKELIWIDFKAAKISGKDSNPDIGTPNKMIKFIKDGNFYLVYIIIYYEELENGMQFVKKENKLCEIYFLKDISHTFRRNPKNQLQVNISASPEVRTRVDFINLLYDKIKESHSRQIQISQNALKVIEESKEIELLKEANNKSEDIIRKL